MIVRCEQIEIDPIFLLMHESNSPLARHPFDDGRLAVTINAALESVVADRPISGGTLEFVTLIPPTDNGLSRWSIEWRLWNDREPTRYTASRGISRPGQIRAELPPVVVAVLRALADKTLQMRKPR